MDTDTKIRKKIMRQVYAIYMLRLLAKPEVRLSVLALSVLGITPLVSLRHIASNAYMASASFPGFFTYVIDAFVTTDVLVQTLSLVVLGVILITFADVYARVLSHIALPKFMNS